MEKERKGGHVLNGSQQAQGGRHRNQQQTKLDRCFGEAATRSFPCSLTGAQSHTPLLNNTEASSVQG